ncbi:MAG: ribbon-helix-helix protein, CopG family [Candidatus Caenarcaniphilales bacterium]|nr:ribbon-helix-helix protein, CopG family [Candidatus Caenarcaniphilales bacterium]
MFALRLDPEVEKELEELSKKTGRSKSYHARAALKQYLEDRADYLKAVAILEKGNPRIPIEEVRRQLGLED